jgi:alkyldihydroxyacetonephosphate synthase
MLDSATLIHQLTALLTKEQINTNKDDLYDAAADRYKKFAKARKVLNVPSPIAIVYPKNTEEIRELLMFCNEHEVNVIPRGGKTATEGGLENMSDISI